MKIELKVELDTDKEKDQLLLLKLVELLEGNILYEEEDEE